MAARELVVGYLVDWQVGGFVVVSFCLARVARVVCCQGLPVRDRPAGLRLLPGERCCSQAAACGCALPLRRNTWGVAVWDWASRGPLAQQPNTAASWAGAAGPGQHTKRLAPFTACSPVAHSHRPARPHLRYTPPPAQAGGGRANPRDEAVHHRCQQERAQQAEPGGQGEWEGGRVAGCVGGGLMGGRVGGWVGGPRRAQHVEQLSGTAGEHRAVGPGSCLGMGGELSEGENRAVGPAAAWHGSWSRTRDSWWGGALRSGTAGPRQLWRQRGSGLTHAPAG